MAAKETRPKKRHIGRQKNIGGEYFMEKPKKLPQEPWWRKKGPQKIYKAEGGRAGYNIGGRANLLEEMGRLDAEKMNPNRRAEKHRVIGELNKGYKSGGKVLKGKKVGCQIK